MQERNADEAEKLYRKHLSDGDKCLVREEYSLAIGYYIQAKRVIWDGLTTSEKCSNYVKLSAAYVGRANLLPNESQSRDFLCALMYAERAIQLCPRSAEAHRLAAKAALSLNSPRKAKRLCKRGLKLSPGNLVLENLMKEIKSRISDMDVISAIENRGVKLGRALYEDYTQSKPRLSDKKVLHWPVLLRFMCDGGFCGYHTLESVPENQKVESLVEMFSPEYIASLPAGQKEVYASADVELYYLVHAITLLGKADVTVENTNNDIYTGYKFALVDKSMTLEDVLQQEDFVVTGIPVFYITLKPGYPGDFFK